MEIKPSHEILEQHPEQEVQEALEAFTHRLLEARKRSEVLGEGKAARVWVEHADEELLGRTVCVKQEHDATASCNDFAGEFELLQSAHF